jgi:gamma-glutamyltranspeptidase/glutathione hydrolase
MSPTTEGDNGVVCSPDDRASSAGLQILMDGGSAADAAVGVSAVLAVVAQNMCGMGGDLIAVVAAGDSTEALMAAGRAGSGASAEAMRSEGLTEIPSARDIRAVTVPGCVDGWLALHGRRGRLPLERVLSPAIDLATSGFEISPLLASGLARVSEVAGADDLFEGGPPVEGDLRRRTGLGEMLQAIVNGGRDAWYLGAFGDALIELGRGLYSSADLEHSCAEWLPTLTMETSYGQIHTAPAPSQGYITVLGAAILDELRCRHPDAGLWPHLQIEAFRAAGYDRIDLLGDGFDAAQLLNAAEVSRRADLIDPTSTVEWPQHPVPGGTVAVTVVDAEGSSVSLTQSNASGFGARIVVPGIGVWLHNRGTGFSLVEGAPNELRPSARPAHTLAPLIVRDGAGVTAIATRGGDTQPQILLQVLDGMASGRSAGDVLADSRWMLGSVGYGAFDVWRRSPTGELLQAVKLEAGTPDAWRSALESANHVVDQLAWGGAFGHAQVAKRDDAGHLSGGSDPRALTGAAVAW